MTYIQFKIRFIFIFLTSLILIQQNFAQRVITLTQTIEGGVVGLDRKAFGGPYSQGYHNDFDLGASVSPCEKIVSINLSVSGSGGIIPPIPPGCNGGPLYVNVYYGCDVYNGAGGSCPVANVLAEPNYPFGNLSYTSTFSCNNHDFQFDGNFSVDVVPVWNTNCTNGQDAINQGYVAYTGTITVTITTDLISCTGTGCLEGTTSSVSCDDSDPCTVNDMVMALDCDDTVFCGTCAGTPIPPEDASFTFADFCEGAPNTPVVTGTTGGIFTFDPNPGDGATINATTGEITGGIGGATYTVRYTTPGDCFGTFTATVTVNPSDMPSFDFDDFCVGNPNGPTNINPTGGTFSFSTQPGDGATIDPTTGVITGPTANTYDIRYTSDGTCPGSTDRQVTATVGPSGSLSGIISLCPGDCDVITFVASIGTAPFEIGINIVGFPSITIPNLSANETFNICYIGMNPPAYDAGTNTITLPESLSGSITLNLISISDTSPCSGNPSGSATINLSSLPIAISPLPILECADASGQAIFDLTQYDDEVNGNTGFTVIWYEDAGGNFIIGTPSSYSSPGGTVYAAVDNGNCISVLVPVVLIVEDGNITLNNFSCNLSGTNFCSICANQTNGLFDLNFTFQDNQVYTVTVEESDGNQFTGDVDNFTSLTVTANISTVFSIIDIQLTSGANCPNILIYNEQVNIVINLNPDVPSFTVDCIGSEGTITVTNLPSGHSLSLNNGPFQNTNTFTNIMNGTYTVTMSDDVTECENQVTVSVNCGCPTPAILTLPTDSISICEGLALEFTGVTFMSPTTEVSLTTSGAGTFNMTTFNTTPFGFIYTPGVPDFNRTINITFTTNDPDGTGPCSATVEVLKLRVLPNPVGTISGDIFVCNGTESTLTVAGGVSYLWSNGSSNATTTFTGIVSDTMVGVRITGTNGCRDSISQSIMVGDFTAGRDTMASFCNTVNANINLNSYISNGAMLGGIWKNGMDTILNVTNYPVVSLGLGNHVLLYIVSDVVCGRDTAYLNIQIRTGNNAGIDNSISVCETENSVNLTSLLGVHDAGGTWESTTTGAPNVSAQGEVSWVNISSGIYIYRYIIPDDGCTADTAIIVLNIIEYRTAGPFSSVTRCVGADIDLRDIINEPTLSGVVQNPNNYAGLNGTIWNTTGLAAGTYTFQYFIDNDVPCSDVIEPIEIVLQENLNAGNDITVTVCEGRSIDLRTLLNPNADAGGVFLYQGQSIPNSRFTPSDGLTTYNIIYEVGDDVTCPKQTSMITLNTELAPSLNIDPINDVCVNDCADLTINNLNASSGIVFLTFSLSPSNDIFTHSIAISNNTPTINICGSMMPPFNYNLLPNNQEVTVNIDSIVTSTLSCPFEINSSISFDILPLPEIDINPVLCPNVSTIIGGTTFDRNNRSGTVLLPGIVAGDCDRLANVSVTFYPEAIGSFERTFCNLNESITIGGQLFDLGNPTGSVLLISASANGCDSTVNVNLSYNPIVVPGFFNFSTCDKDFIYTVGSEIFNIDRPNGSVTLQGAAEGGCDSLVTVALEYLEMTIGFEILDACDDQLGVLNILNISQAGPFTLTNSDVNIQTFNNLPVSIPLPIGDYSLTLTNSNNCMQTLEFTLNSELIPDVSLIQNLNENGTVQILTNASPNTIFDLSWNPSFNLSCNNCPDPIANPSETTTYTLSYSYGNRCTGAAQIIINRINTTIIFPNILIPNSNSINNSFYVTLPEGMVGTVASMRIFDRWGNKVFEKFNVMPNDPSEGWSGGFNGRSISAGVYIYSVELILNGSNNPTIYSGDITVIE